MASHPQRRFDTADGAAGEPPQGLVAMLVGPRLESLHLLSGSQRCGCPICAGKGNRKGVRYEKILAESAEMLSAAKSKAGVPLT